MAASAAHDDEEIAPVINITPLVDIFLVLLIIFMITSTVIDQRQIDVSLPKAAHAGAEAPKATGLYMDKERRIYVEGRLTDSSGAAEELKRLAAGDSLHQVLIGADQELAYGQVVKAIDIVRGAGISKYALKVVRALP